MKRIELLVTDGSASLCGRLPVEQAGAVVAALAADPWTCDELQFAMKRFLGPASPVEELCPRPDALPAVGTEADERPMAPFDCVIDLPARLLLTRWNQVQDPIPTVLIPRDAERRRVVLYDLSPEWRISSAVDAWLWLSPARRADRSFRWETELRTALYGSELFRFVMQQGQSRCPAPVPRQPLAAGAVRADESTDGQRRHAVREIHRSWMRSQPPSLRGQSVRQIMTVDREHIAADLTSRELQWTWTGQAPTALRTSDTAYRLAGFGPHECLLYDELVMILVESYLERLDGDPNAGRDDGIELGWLREVRDQWLWEPDNENLMGKTPSEVIDLERRRIPLVVEDRSRVLHDDCPVCQMMLSDESAPMFCRLDSRCDAEDLPPCNMETDGVGAGMGTADEELELPDMDEARRRGLNPVLISVDFDTVSHDLTHQAAEGPLASPSDAIWKRVSHLTEPGEVSPDVDLFVVAACTGELIEDLKERDAPREWIDALNRHVSNLSTSWNVHGITLLEPVITRFCECLDDLGGAHPELADKVDDLQYRLLTLVEDC